MTSPQTAGRSRARVFLAVLAGLLLVAGGLFARFYDPLVDGGFSAPQGSGATRVDDPVLGTAFVAQGPEGSTATFVYSVRNDGPVAVRVYAPGADGVPDDVVDVRWAPLMGPDRAMGGVRPDPTASSMRVAPGDVVAMWVTSTKPPCSPGGSSTLMAIPVRWSVFGIGHVHQFELSPKGPPPLVQCKD